MAKKKKAKKVSIDEVMIPIEEVELAEYTEECMGIYSRYVAENRAIPDFRDGLKPVHRRILYSMVQNGLSSTGGFRKSSLTVGHCLGSYHPHSDSALYGALVGLYTSVSNPLIEGSGNFGSLLDGAAAMRYTECRLSKLADKVYMGKEALKVCDYVPNFDSSTTEPVILNSKLPMMLLNGSYGLVPGARVCLPSFELEGVLKLTKKAIKKGKVTVNDCVQNLVPCTYEGGLAYLEDDEELNEFIRFIKTGEGAIYWVPDYELDIEGCSILITGYPPSTIKSLEKCLNACKQDERIIRISDDENDVGEDGRPLLKYRLYIKPNKNKKYVEETLLDLTSYFEANQSVNFILTERFYNEEKAECDVKTHFDWNMCKFFEEWAKWRISIEKKIISLKIDQAQAQLDRQLLLELMVINRDVIIKALDEKDSEAVLVKRLKITQEQAVYIMDSKVRSLKKLELVQVQAKIKQLKAELKELKMVLKDPVNYICDDLKQFEKL